MTKLLKYHIVKEVIQEKGHKLYYLEARLKNNKRRYLWAGVNRLRGLIEAGRVHQPYPHIPSVKEKALAKKEQRRNKILKQMEIDREKREAKRKTVYIDGKRVYKEYKYQLPDEWIVPRTMEG